MATTLYQHPKNDNIVYVAMDGNECRRARRHGWIRETRPNCAERLRIRSYRMAEAARTHFGATRFEARGQSGHVLLRQIFRENGEWAIDYTGHAKHTGVKY